MATKGFLEGLVLPMAVLGAGTVLGSEHRARDRRLRHAAEREQASRGGYGHSAARPGEIPARGWKEILGRVWQQLGADNISIVSAGVAFYALLAVFPAIAAAVTIYGLFAEPQTVQQQLGSVAHMLPQEAQSVLTGQLTAVTQAEEAALGFGALFALLFALWSASAGVRTMMDALNVAYEEREKRSLLKYYSAALILTLGGIVFAILMLALVAVLPPLLKLLPIPGGAELWIKLLRWPLIAVVLMLGLAVLYRYGPSRNKAQWRWVSWGAASAAVLWLIASALFSVYVGNFGSYNETYGSLGAVIVLMMWLYISAYVVLAGAELNSEMERQTAHDTTRTTPRPMGRRGAVVADTVAAPA